MKRLTLTTLGTLVCSVVLIFGGINIVFADTQQALYDYCVDAGIDYAGGCHQYASDMAASGTVAPAMSGGSGGASGELYTPRYLPPIIQGAQGPGELVFLVYKYLMGLVGIVAVGVIIYGGVLRTVSASQQKVQQSNAMIKNALKGIVLLFGAQVIFNTINPNIVNIARIQSALQPKEKIAPRSFMETLINFADEATSTPGGTAQSATNLYGGQKLVCAEGKYTYPNCGPQGSIDLATKIQSCVDCELSGFNAGYRTADNACFGAGPQERGGCLQNKAVMEKLKALNVLTTGTNLSGWLVTGSYPPGANHQSSCHWNGTCVDIAFTGSATSAKVDAFIRAAQKAGLTVVNEYGTGTVIKPETYSTTTGGHLHVRL